MFQRFTVRMSQFNNQSDRTRGVMDGDLPPILKEEQEDEIYISNKSDASLHSEENSPSQVTCCLTCQIQFTPKKKISLKIFGFRLSIKS